MLERSKEVLEPSPPTMSASLTSNGVNKVPPPQLEASTSTGQSVARGIPQDHTEKKRRRQGKGKTNSKTKSVPSIRAAARQQLQTVMVDNDNSLHLSNPSSPTTTMPTSSSSGALGGRQPKKLNQNTYTWHSLGDYPDMILLRGTTDSYTSERVCCQVSIVICKKKHRTHCSFFID